MYFSDPAAMVGRSQEFQAVVDSLASGCLLAGLWNWLGARQRYQRLLRSGWFYLVPAATAAAVALQGRPRITYWVGQTVLNIGIAVCIERLVRYSGQAPAALFDLAAVRWVGVLSYSLYLWQQLFLNRNSTHWMTAFPVNLILCFTVAACSYYLVEKPFLRWKVRWSAHKRT
jgi:peptidoglycan/LPS O-acetylase OafA/YrhL